MPKRTLQGVVVSDKQKKTLVVRVERRYTHPLFKKTVRHSKKYYAHDEKNEFKVGDIVWIEEHRPISKLKRWVVERGVKRQTSPCFRCRLISTRRTIRAPSVSCLSRCLAAASADTTPSATQLSSL